MYTESWFTCKSGEVEKRGEGGRVLSTRRKSGLFFPSVLANIDPHLGIQWITHNKNTSQGSSARKSHHSEQYSHGASAFDT